ncbi:Mycothiol acetyltransferase [Nocardioides dokdonensis FR1436]|uniref:Mycothiol acetyltransferase n=1 Tax=Nocardioides dokdonensis FR1436 TaxID=1300347 RepID=A0A1A9GL48_9ACTN|nr:GNAT family N-acetyltransferase [Nocardioides dokdonensis]ANH38382.1 Mycothiol acetyltransferase [Nocardioides dokdonensis FR1436]
MTAPSGTGELRIEAVDPFDDDTFEAWHAVYLSSQRHVREPAAVTAWTLGEMRPQMQAQGSKRWAGAFLGRVDEVPVASGYLATPLLDNLAQAQVSLDVGPDHRGRGHGSTMLAHLLRQAASRGRDVVTAETSWEWDAPVDGAGRAGPALLRRHGFELGLTEVLRVLDLPVAAERLHDLAAQAAPHHAAYPLRSFVGRVPDELAEQWAAITASLSTEAPVGSLSVEAETGDVALLREEEDMLARQARTRYASVALTADGQVAGYTEIVTTEHEPGKAYQWGTVIRREHRGRRLGSAVKTATLLLLQEHVADLHSVRTWNADSNTHMVAVNDALGYRPVERLGTFERRV